MAKNLSKQTVRDYVGLYLWLKKQMSSHDWREFTTYIHGKAGYHDVTAAYLNFKKEFEAATRGYIENKGITSAKNLTDEQIKDLMPMLSKVEDKGSIKTFNLMLGNVFGNDAGRYIALMTAMQAEARADRIARELAAERQKNQQLRGLNVHVDISALEAEFLEALKKEFTTINESLAVLSNAMAANHATTNTNIANAAAGINANITGAAADINANVNGAAAGINANITGAAADINAHIDNAVANINANTNGVSARVMTKIHNLEQALWSNLANLTRMVSDLSTELGITSATVINISEVQNKMYGDIIDIKTAQTATNVELTAIRNEIQQMNILMQNYFASTPTPPPSTPTAAPSGVSKGWKVGTFVAGGLALVLLGTTIWAGTYHGRIPALKNQNSSLSAQVQQQQVVIDQLQANFDSLLLKFDELQKAPTQAALVDYINLRQELDVMFIVALNDNRITPEEAEQIRTMAEQIAHIDITISLANPNLGEFVNSVLNTIDKYDMTISTLNNKIIELENIIANTDDEGKIKELMDQKKKLEEEKEKIMAEYAEYKASHTHSNEEYEKTMAEYERLLKEKGQELDEANRKLAEAKTPEEYAALYNKYEQAYNNWQDALTAYELYQIETNAHIQKLEGEIARLNGVIEEQQKIIDAYEAQGPSSGISKEQYEQAIKDKQAAEQKYAAEQKAHAETKALLEEARKTITSLNTTVNNIRKEFDDYKLTHNYTDAQYQQIQDAFDKLQDAYDDAVEKLKYAMTPEEYQAVLDELNAYKSIADSVFAEFYGTSGSCTPEQFAAILSQFGFNVQQNPGDASPDINQRGK